MSGENPSGLLEIRNLRVDYGSGKHFTRVLDGISFSLSAGECLGLTGESGAGKSTVAYAIMGNLPGPGRIPEGSIRFRGENLIRHYHKHRWKDIAMIFQGAMNALNPVLKIGVQMEESLKIHTALKRTQRKERIAGLLEKVRMDRAWADRYPHQLSGGMKQRILIAIALSCNPSLLIADEPTTNLDVLTQKEIIDLIRKLKAESGLSILFISHDLALLHGLCERLIVLHRGKIAEQGSCGNVLQHPEHPHTSQLLHFHRKISENAGHYLG